MTREELIAALERAEGPSNVLDGLIFMHIYPMFGQKPWRRTGQRFWDDSDPYGLHYEDAPRYTSSLDAALTLVPEEAQWLVRDGDPDHMTDTRPYGHIMRGNVNRDRSRSLGEAHHPVPAIALCIAALRARTA